MRRPEMSLSPVSVLKQPAIPAGIASDSLFRQISFFELRHNAAKLLGIGTLATGVVVR